MLQIAMFSWSIALSKMFFIFIFFWQFGDSIVAPDAHLWNSHVLHVHGMGETTGTTFGLSLDFLHYRMRSCEMMGVLVFHLCSDVEIMLAIFT